MMKLNQICVASRSDKGSPIYVQRAFKGKKTLSDKANQIFKGARLVIVSQQIEGSQVF